MPLSGILIFLIPFLFSLFLQTQIFFRFFYKQSSFNEFLLLLFSQWENVAFYLSLTFLWVTVFDLKKLRVAFSVLLFALILYLPFDFGFYTTFFQHFQFGLLEGQETSFTRLKDSLIAEFSFWNILNNLIAIFVIGTLFSTLSRKKFSEALHRRRFILFIVSIILYLPLSYLVTRYQSNQNLSQNPFITVLLSKFSSPQKGTQKYAAITTEDIETIRYGTPKSDVSQFLFLKPLKDYNLVYIVLESVGSLQSLDAHGRFKQNIFKNLSRYDKRSLIFSDVTNLFPATVRSHVPLSTGGRNITYGSVYHEYTFPYNGPTLVGRLKEAGYKTALYSAAYMEVENLGVFYKKVPYEERFYPEEQTSSFREKNQINSWGVNENVVAVLAAKWAKQQPRYFLHFLTSSTHHPYSFSADFAAPNDDKLKRYETAMSFIDDAISKLIRSLDDGKTVFLITGDHGQAFGDRHATNFTHKNYIYEENIKNFTAIIFPENTQLGSQKSLAQNLFLGDVAPTILDILGLNANGFLGQSALSPHYLPKIRYFYKGALPEQWGLRDGQWKYIANMNGSGKPELYNLDNDPEEKQNLASEYPDRMKEYFGMCQQWYVRSEPEFTKYLTGYFKRSQNQTPGPKTMFFGVLDENKQFKEKTAFKKDDRIVVSTRNVPFRHATPLTYVWIGPNGERDKFDFPVRAGWVHVNVLSQPDFKFSDGIWKVQIQLHNAILLENTFYVKN